MPEQTVTLTSKVKIQLVGLSLLDYLCKRFPYKNQTAWEQDILSGKVVLNGDKTKPSQSLQFQDSVSYTSVRREPTVATNIETIFEDEHLWVVNKPAPLPVHADGVFILHTLIHILREKSQNPRLRLGHRLDRETTGLLVLAKHEDVTPKLMTKFEDAHVQKLYLTVVKGEVDFEEKLVSGWMGTKPGCKIKKRQFFSAHAIDGYKKSATRFTLQKKYKDYSLLSCEMLSGRTNQIRTHLEAIGFPIAGDKLYGRQDEEYLHFLQHLRAGGDISGGGNWEHPRHLLHAWKLSLEHPITGEKMNWEAPMPQDMTQFLERNI